MKKSPFRGWLVYLEKICQSLSSSKSTDPATLLQDGIRITLSVQFSRIAKLKAFPPEQFSDIFLHPPSDIPLSTISNETLPDEIGETLELFADPEFPGRFYGECLKYSLNQSVSGKISLVPDPVRKKSGSFYTPSVITEYIAEKTIAPLLQDAKREDIYAMKICDPAMGTGNFLIAAGKYLSQLLKGIRDSQESLFDWDDALEKMVIKCLFGVDRDPISILIARSYFALFCGADPARITNFVVADSLLDEFPFEHKFDVVIGNPPWVSFGLRSLSTSSAEIDKLYRELYPDSAEYKISIYAVFMEKALRLTKTGGYHGFIVPDSWLAGRYFSKLRSFMLRNIEFSQLILVLKDFWEGLNIGRSVIYIGKRVEKGKQVVIPGAVVLSPDFLAEAVSLDHSVSLIKSRERNRIIIYPDSQARDIIEKMEQSGDILGKYIRFYSGLIGKNGRDSIVIDEKPADYSPEMYGRLIDSGKSLEKHGLTYFNKFMSLSEDVYKSGYSPDKYFAPKLFVNQTGFSLKAYYDDEGFFSLNNLHIAYPVDEGIDLKFYAVLLNSKLIDFFYKTVSMEQGRALAQTDIDFLHQIPVGTNKEKKEEIVGLIRSEYLQHTYSHDENAVTRYYTLTNETKERIEVLIGEWYGL